MTLMTLEKWSDFVVGMKYNCHSIKKEATCIGFSSDGVPVLEHNPTLIFRATVWSNRPEAFSVHRTPKVLYCGFVKDALVFRSSEEEKVVDLMRKYYSDRNDVSILKFVEAPYSPTEKR